MQDFMVLFIDKTVHDLFFLLLCAKNERQLHSRHVKRVKIQYDCGCYESEMQ